VIRDPSSGHWAVVNEAPALLSTSAPLRSGSVEIAPDQDEESVAPRSDAARLRAMVDRHMDFTWRSLRRLGLSPDAADDATQRVFIVAHERLGDIAPGREKAFLFNTAVRVASTARRTYARRREVLDGEPSFNVADPSPRADELLDRQRARALLEELLDGMDMDLRAVFVLFELEGMTMSEISATIDIPEGTVASRLRRARAEFQGMLKRYQARRPGGTR
jgi:RNA polymerase sigma-70 factor (ECF subfamily)